MDWKGDTARSINNRPFYPHVQFISVVNPNPNEGVFMMILNPDFKSGNPGNWGKDPDWNPISDVEFTQLLESKADIKVLQQR